VEALGSRIATQHAESMRSAEEMSSAVEGAVCGTWADIEQFSEKVLSSAASAHSTCFAALRPVERDGQTPVRRPAHKPRPISTAPDRDEVMEMIVSEARRDSENVEPNSRPPKIMPGIALSPKGAPVPQVVSKGSPKLAARVSSPRVLLMRSPRRNESPSVRRMASPVGESPRLCVAPSR
jgi:hypothetical protein